MKKILVFDPIITGHHLEYIWHIYSYICSCDSLNAVFILNPCFKEKNTYFPMTENERIKFVYVDNDVYDKIKDFWSLKSAFYRCKILNYYIKEFFPDFTILITLFSFFPFLPFLKKRGKIRGIVYSLYTRKKISSISALMHKCFYYETVYNSAIDKVFLLNDQSSVFYLEKKYKTNKFYFLPDPFLPLSDSDNMKIHESDELNKLDKNVAKRYIHFGSMAYRKGSIDILDAFLQYDGELRISLILLGKIVDEIKDAFYEKINLLSLKENVELFVKDSFCSYKMIEVAIQMSDYILMPYHNVSQSSGMLGYASFYNKAVIGPNDGLIGELIEQYALGYTLDVVSATSLLNIIQITSKEETISINGNKYLENNTPNIFSKILLG